MFRHIGLGIQVTKGDTVRFPINLDGVKHPIEGTALFTVRQQPWNGSNVMIEKEIEILDNKVYVFLSSDDTNIPPEKYIWDLRLKILNAYGEIVETPMAYSTFDVLGVVGDV